MFDGNWWGLSVDRFCCLFLFSWGDFGSGCCLGTTEQLWLMALRFLDQSRAQRGDGSAPVAPLPAHEEAAPSDVGNVALMSWIQRSIVSWDSGPEAKADLDAAALAQALASAGATGIQDFLGLTGAEVRAVWPPCSTLSVGFLAHLLARAPGMLLEQSHQQQASSEDRQPLPVTASPTDREVHEEAGNLTEVAKLALAMEPLRLAKLQRCLPSPDSVAVALRRLALLPQDVVQQRWLAVAGSLPPELPAARATWFEQIPLSVKDLVQDLLAEETIWRELGQWRRSAAQYATAVALWGRAAAAANELPWPPKMVTLDAFCFYFRSGASLGIYLSHLRAVMRLARAAEGALVDTGAVVRGSAKLLHGGSRRFRARASAEQTRALARIARVEFDRPDVADSWVIARQFCLRYGSEMVPLSKDGLHSSVQERMHEAKLELTITLHQRKLQTQSVQVTRRCICALQGRRLCGVRALHRYLADSEGGRLFPAVSYADSLALLKCAADQLKLENASAWGTHAFRRGWADEALRAGGPTALFYSGGWRGVAAFAYAAAQTRGAISSAEWLVDFSDSSGEETV